MCLLALASCGRPPAQEKASVELPGDQEEELADGTAIRTEMVTLEHKDEEGKLVYRATAQRSRTAIEGEELNEVRLADVEGELFEEGKLASTFTAPAGRAKNANRTLSLAGGVTITSEEQGLKLEAERVVWTEGEGLIEAAGEVVISNDKLELGPAQKIFAEPDLSRIGTPDQFL